MRKGPQDYPGESELPDIRTPTDHIAIASTHYSLRQAIDELRWRSFGAWPTVWPSPEGPPIGRLRMAVCPCPEEGPMSETEDAITTHIPLPSKLRTRIERNARAKPCAGVSLFAVFPVTEA